MLAMVETGRSIEGQQRRRGKIAAFALTTALAGVAGIPPLWAQSQSQPTLVAQARSFNIPAGPLADALVQFGYQSGLQVAADGNLTAAARSPGVSGTYAPADALTRLLTGSGLTFHFSGSRTVQLVIAPASDAGTINLPPVQVQGQTRIETAYGPGVGYVATQSSRGTKRDTPIIETPQSISVVTRKQMDDQNAQSVGQALRYTSGIVPEEHGD